MLTELFGVTITGLGAHQLYKPTTALGPRWGSLTRYGIGILILLPCMLVVNRRLARTHYKNPPATQDEDAERLTIVYLISAVFLAIGVVFGHFLDRILGRDE